MKHIFFVLLALYFTLASSQQQYVVTVGSSASANYATINAALSSVKSGVTWEVRIEPGVYTEQLIVNRPNGIIRALGEPGSVIVRFPGLRNTRDNATVSINQPHVKMYGITMHQMMPEEAGIAITLIVFASNVSFYECNILGFQDTLWFRNSRSIAYFKDCYIEGGVDFIYGSGLGYFDNCTLASNKRGGCISALQGGQATLKDKFIFNFCKLIPTIPSTLLSPYANTNLSYTDPSQFEKANYLGRPWDTFSRVIFMYSEMANHINPAGWSTWSGRVGYYYREYNNTGPGGVFGVDRVDFTSLLTPDEGVSLTFAAMFGSQNPYWVDSNYGPTMCPGEGDQCGGADFTGLACCQFPFSCVSSASGNPTCQYVAPVARDNGTVEVSTISSESLTSLTINNAFGSVSAAYDGAGSSIVVTADYTNAISTSIGLSASSSSEYDVTYSPLSDPRGVAIDIQVQLPADSSVVVPGSGVLPPCLASLELSVVNSWISNGVTYQQYQIRFTNTGSLVVSSVTAQLTISDQSTIGQYWNIYPSGNGVYSFPDYYKWHTYQIGGNAQDSGFILSGPAPLSASISVASLTCSL